MQNKTKNPSKKLLARQEKIKAVALELFLTKGYQETSLSDIIKLSGGSYSNIYDNYQDKKGLFFAILEDASAKHFESMAQQIKDIQSQDLREILYSFGIAFLDVYNQKLAITLGKIIHSQVYSADKYIENFIQNNQAKFVYTVLAECFKKQENVFLSKNATRCAEMFCIMLKEPHHTLAILANKEMMSKKEQEEHVKFVVDIFLKGIENK